MHYVSCLRFRDGRTPLPARMESVSMVVAVVYVLWGLGGVSIIFCIIMVALTISRLHIDVEDGYNDNDEAKKRFLDLVNDTHEELLIHDNGDSTYELYNDSEVIQSVETCLNKGVIIRCLFNEEASLRMVERLHRHEGLQIYYLNVKPPDCDIHYKIVDHGRRTYLSWHCENGERQYKMIDCSRAPSAKRRLYRDYKGRFDEGVRNARRLPVAVG